MSLIFNLTEDFLSSQEQAVFSDYLKRQDVDENVWQIYLCYFEAESRWTRPLVLRVFQDDRLIAAALLLECRHVGRSLFKSSWLYNPVNWLGTSVIIWLRAGFGPEVIANPGFYAQDVNSDLIAGEMISYLHSKSVAFFITDYRVNAFLHERAKVFPYVDEGTVDVSGMETVQDYIAEHSNLKRKIRSFKNKGGTIEVFRGMLVDKDQKAIVKCCDSTMRKSFVYTPFQDIFLDVIQETLHCDSSSFVHIITKMDGEITGYHSYMETGSTLRMLHGAFNRNLKTTHHAYENLLIATVDHAIEQKLKKVYFGPIMNETKRRMMRESEPCSTYFYSCNPVIRFIFALMYSRSQLQNKKLMAFASK